MRMNRYILSGSAFLTVFLTPLAWADDLADVLVLTNDQVAELWTLEHKEAPGYPTEALQRGITGCLALAYVIEADGSTSNHKALAGNPGFEHSARRAASRFRYEATGANPERQRVLTTNTFTYEISDGRSRKGKDNVPGDKSPADPCTEAANRILTGQQTSAETG